MIVLVGAARTVDVVGHIDADAGLALPAYEQMLTASHTFNLLDARQAISVSERQRFILRVRTMARGICEAYFASREKLGFPMVDSVQTKGGNK